VRDLVRHETAPVPRHLIPYGAAHAPHSSFGLAWTSSTLALVIGICVTGTDLGGVLPDQNSSSCRAPSRPAANEHELVV